MIFQETVTEVPFTEYVRPLITSTGLTASVTWADFVESCVLVAVRVTDVPVVGAVRLPVGVMLPAEVDQV